MIDAADERIAGLERAVESDPGAKGFAALAELHRRAGRLEEAERVLRRGLAVAPDVPEAQAVLALVLDDAGRDTELRRVLEDWARRAVGDADGEGVSSDEIERAFADAEPDAEALITPDRVAEEAALGVDGAMALESPLEGAFATRTMADLLERQGDHEGAARIRARLDAGAAARVAAAPTGAPDALHGGADALPASSTLAVLQRWLGNARRMHT